MHQTGHSTQTSHILASYAREVHQPGPADRCADLAEQEHGNQAGDLRGSIVGSLSELAVGLRRSEHRGEVILELLDRPSCDTT